MLDWVHKVTTRMALSLSLRAGGFSRRERAVTLTLNNAAGVVRLRTEIFPLLAEDLGRDRRLGRMFVLGPNEGLPGDYEMSFYVADADVLVRFRRHDEKYGLTLFWRAEPQMFFYSDLCAEDWPHDPFGHIVTTAPLLEIFCDRFLAARAAGGVIPFERDYFEGMVA